MLAGSVLLQRKIQAVLLRRGRKGPDILVCDLDIGHAGVVLHKLPERLLAVPEWGIILVLFHIRQHLLHGLLQELGGHFTGLHTKRKGFLRDFFLQGVHLRSPLPYRSWLTRDV